MLGSRHILRAALPLSRTLCTRISPGKIRSPGYGMAAARSLTLASQQKILLPLICQLPKRGFLTSAPSFAESRRLAQVKSDGEMAEFLAEEIQAEKESLKATGKAVQVKGFDVSTDDADVTFKKNFNGEEITVRVNVNHSVEAEFAEDEQNPAQQQQQQSPDAPPMTKMVCRPNFSVTVVKGGYTLSFECSQLRDEEDDEDQQLGRNQQTEENYQDMFSIDEFSVYKGERKDMTYVMSGEVMDGNFYDNLMNMLDERGINSDFVRELVDFCTLYEQKLYVNLLENLMGIVKP
ncbi:complement component 1 Q subcomponent-binding protein, mitochondrial-like [Paramacrobiotus metropolitanus]|uniref:complement component 1 Q subcomponent-binding protein, mitochondrial-like n=1 Tax=Paramacrobiotus metropolitanus TaxID=2943436 RepID=UPI0024463099|nr:complement component 1 Q subcomponent-binding protein, mitochondrial-like [Paramacrobiotus metropolitanus]